MQKTFPELLEEFKQEHNLKTDKELSDKTGIPANVICWLFSGARLPTAGHLSDIIDGFEIKPGSTRYYELLDVAFNARLATERKQRRYAR